ncbi:hypothetical protein [Acanthopleuribacter pedis]|uniref:Uncharacterized protein n=1 Tax=Acanthopleuribacter pedis TaxID=442870 RepID=A0A8J7QCR6_9BACT|nr:hypothetical protein [Acanthopleuribacter pedis]MBO1322107.1 hypothetical protein [Acanthopleuribacter pedis]
MKTHPRRQAWVWRDLARVKAWLSHPRSEIDHAFLTALNLSEQEPRIKKEYDRWKAEQRDH